MIKKVTNIFGKDKANKDESNIFKPLTPVVLDKNKEVYTKALDSAFLNKDVRNIAITGIYGAGKSSVWRTYVKAKDLKNIITVVLGKYDDNKLESNSKEEHKEAAQIREDNKEERKEINRVERQMISQILSQIPSKKIYLSKYKIKENKTILSLSFYSFMLFVSILLWSAIIFKDTFKPLVNLITKTIENYLPLLIDFINKDLLSFLGFICVSLFSTYFIYDVIKNRRFTLKKVNVQGIEADFKDATMSDETILERDMKEIVYLLASSDTGTVVFEDLDRYDNIDIYNKLRELNFLVNSFLATKAEQRVIRFVYMLRDGMIDSKSRVKFFDFIVPIVPVMDANSSYQNLLDRLKEFTDDKYPNKNPTEEFLLKISSYIDDMRLLNSIVNEFFIYKNIINTEDKRFDANKLFALIVVKNIFPEEFDLLQDDKGYIFNILKKIEVYKKDFIEHRRRTLRNILEAEKTLIKDYYTKFATFIPDDIRWHNYATGQYSVITPEFLEEKSKNISDIFEIVYSGGIKQGGFNFYSFFYYICGIDHNKDNLSKIDLLINKTILGLEEQRLRKSNIISFIQDIDLIKNENYFYCMTNKEKDDLFKDEQSKIVSNYNFPLLRFLIINAFIDETYHIYKGRYSLNSLGKNDQIFLNQVLAKKEGDYLLKLENKNKVIEYIKLEDYNSVGILNLYLMKWLLKIYNEKLDLDIDLRIFIMIKVVKENNKIDILIKILSYFTLNELEKFIEIIHIKEHTFLNYMINRVENKSLYRSLLFVYYKLTKDDLLLKQYIEASIGDDLFYNIKEELDLVIQSNIDSYYLIGYLEKNQIVLDSLSFIDKYDWKDKQEIYSILFKTDKIKFTQDNIEKYWKDVYGIHDISFIQFININLISGNEKFLDYAISYTHKIFDIGDNKKVLKNIPDICNKIILDHALSNSAFDFILDNITDIIELNSLDDSFYKDRIYRISEHNKKIQASQQNKFIDFIKYKI